MDSTRIRVIIADDNIEFCETVLAYLNKQEDIEVIETAHDGIEAYDKIKLLKPDVAILDGAMPGLDGLGVLEKLSKDETRPVCIMLSNLRHESVTQYAYSLGAEYYIIKPFEMETLTKRIRMFHNTTPLKIENVTASHEVSIKNASLDLEKRIATIFIEIGIPTHIRGYNYMRTAIIMAVNKPEILYFITKELYPAVGQKCNASASSVERAIRTAIDVARNREKKDTNRHFFVDTFSHCNGKPTNAEFIAFIAEKLRMEMPS